MNIKQVQICSPCSIAHSSGFDVIRISIDFFGTHVFSEICRYEELVPKYQQKEVNLRRRDNY